MKKTLITVSVLLASYYSNAQVHLKGVNGAEITASVTGKGIGFSGAYSRFLSAKFYYKAGLFYENAKLEDANANESVKTSNYILDANLIYTPVNLANRKFFIGPLLGASCALETIAKTELTKSESNFIYGLNIGAESELYLRDNFAVIFNFTQRYYPTSEIGTLRYNLGGGFKLTF